MRLRKKFVLDAAQNARLRDWQFQHLSLTWAERPEPWKIEESVIAIMQPPLNCATNQTHPFYPRVRAARAAFQQRRCNQPAVDSAHAAQALVELIELKRAVPLAWHSTFAGGCDRIRESGLGLASTAALLGRYGISALWCCQYRQHSGCPLRLIEPMGGPLYPGAETPDRTESEEGELTPV